MNEFLAWFFALETDAIIGPWLKSNVLIIGFVLGFPFLAYRWWWRNLKQIRALKNENLTKKEDES